MGTLRINAPKCPYCGRFAVLKDSAEVHDCRQDYGKFWVCDSCDARVGCHSNSKTYAPLGRLANAELRHWKILAHRAFDPMWRDTDMSRNEAYDWLRVQMGRVRPVHIGFMDVDDCRRIIEICGSATLSGERAC